MKKYTANDGEFLVSQYKTKEGNNGYFCYSIESAIDEVSDLISNKYPDIIERTSTNDLWLKESTENTVSLETLKEIVSLDQTDSMVLYDIDSDSVILGVEDWFDPSSLIAN